MDRSIQAYPGFSRSSLEISALAGSVLRHMQRCDGHSPCGQESFEHGRCGPRKARGRVDQMVVFRNGDRHFGADAVCRIRQDAVSVRRILTGHRVQLPHAIVCVEWTSALFAARIKRWKLLPVELGAVRPSVRPLGSYSPNPASISQRTLLRQTPKVRAVCGKAARTDPCVWGRSKELSLPRPIHLPAAASWREWT